MVFDDNLFCEMILFCDFVNMFRLYLEYLFKFYILVGLVFKYKNMKDILRN